MFQNILIIKKEEISKVDYHLLYSCRSCHGKCYGFSKVSKPVTDRLTSLQLIRFAINTISYKLTKVIVPLLTSLTSNNFTIKDSFSFAEEVSCFDCAHVMTGFERESLFTNLLLDGTINIRVENFSKKKTKVNNLTEDIF